MLVNLQSGELPNRGKKRKINHNCNPSPQKRRMSSVWVSATDIRNYLRDDPLLDWLRYHGKKIGLAPKPSNARSYLFKRGDQFENQIMHEIATKIGKSNIADLSGLNGTFRQKVAHTLGIIKKRAPIIYQGAVFNDEDSSFGYPDLIVRVDYLNQIIPGTISEPLTVDDTNTYCIIDIKYSTLRLLKNHTLSNTSSTIAYKGQVAIYNRALNKMTGRSFNSAYLLGKKIRSHNNGNIWGPFEKFAHVNFNQDILTKVVDAVAWIKLVKSAGKKWDISNPHCIELLPNMNNTLDDPWHDVKLQLAKNAGELTLLWNVKTSNRDALWNLGIRSWKDPNFDVNCLSINDKHQHIITDIIKINSQDDQENISFGSSSSCADLKTIAPVELYVDFETCQSYIFMIGMGIYIDGKWSFETFTIETDDLKRVGSTPGSKAEWERDIVYKWLHRVRDVQRRRPTRLIHWGNAEQSIYHKIVARHDLREIHIDWVDLCSLFKDVPIIIRDVFGFGLKEIVGAMYKNGFIQTIWNGKSKMDGQTASIIFNEMVNSHVAVDNSDEVMDTLIEYNRVDCRVLFEILQFIRECLSK